jgi:hypothetical protein
VQSIEKMEQRTMQACVWSQTPRFDRDCIIFGKETVAKVCDGARHLLTEDPSNNYQKDLDLLKGLGLLESLDNIKPLLVWLLGDDVAVKFGIKVKQLSAIAFPLQKPSHEQVTKTLLKAVGDLTGLLVDETSPITNEEFKRRLNPKKVTGIKKLRLDVKTHRAKLDSGLLSAMPEMKDVDQKLDLAKHQVFKWGLLMFLYHKESRVKSEVGKDVRKSLKKLWERHSVDEGFKKYFGEEREKELQTILAVDTAAPAKQGEPGGGKPPEGKRAPAAVAATEAARPRASGKKQWRRQKRPGLPSGTFSAISAL